MSTGIGRHRRSRAALLLGVAGTAALYRLVVTGALTLDLGIGRELRPLGPLVFDISAPRELVFDVIAAPYLGRTPRDVAEHVEIVERGTDVVVANHRTAVPGGLVTTTMESVRFERPHRVAFRLLRGPVPYVAEKFDLEDTHGSTRLRYEGELGTDLWGLGRWWGDVVARQWVATVERSLEDVRHRSEQRAAAQRRRSIDEQ